MAFNEVPKGRIVPFYLTDEGNLYPICFHSEDELELIAGMIATLLDDKVVVDTKTQINDDMYKLIFRDPRQEKT